MLKSALLAGTFGLMMVPAAFADDTNAMNVQCDDATMMMMQQNMDKMTDASMKADKDMAMQEMTAAKTDMQNQKLDSCAMHLGNAMKAMKMDSSMMKKG